VVATSAVNGSTLRRSSRPNKPASAATSAADPSRIGFANTSGSKSTEPTPAIASGSTGNSARTRRPKGCPATAA
jgi:hypothetical protein